MSPRQALAAIEDRGGRVSVRGDRLVLTPAGVATEAERGAILAGRDQLVAVLTLRAVHDALRMTLDDSALIEEALLDGRVDAIEFRPRKAAA